MFFDKTDLPIELHKRLLIKAAAKNSGTFVHYTKNRGSKNILILAKLGIEPSNALSIPIFVGLDNICCIF